MFGRTRNVPPIDCAVNVGFGICSRRLMYHEVTEARSNNIRNLICEDLKIPLLVIRLEVTGLKKTRLVYLLDLFN